MKREFIMTLEYKSSETRWEVHAHDVIIADSLLSLLNQFNVLILALHNRIIKEDPDQELG